MLKKNILRTALCIAVLGITSACDKDYLNRYPLDSPSGETFLNNEDQLEMAVTGAYNSLYSNPAAAPLPFAFALDYVSDIGWERNTNAIQLLGAGLGDANNVFTQNYWSLLYVGIGRCNHILDKEATLAGIVSAEKLSMRLAEVRFLRAYYYFYLNELFGGVPLLTTVIPLSAAQVAKSTKQEVNSFIMEELRAIVSQLPLNNTGDNTGRVTKGAALALLSRAALFNKEFRLAADAAEELMSLNIYSLHPNYGELFTFNGKSSAEIIFATQYNKALQKTHGIPSQYLSRYLGGFSNKIPVQSLVDSYECVDGLTIDMSPLYNARKPFEQRDPRLTQSIVLPQTRLLGVVFETHPDSVQTWDYSGAEPKRVANTDATNAYASFSGYLWRKYIDEADKVDRVNSELPTILFRYAEVLLNFVEAKVELNELDQSVYDAINQVRQRPSVEMPKLATGLSQELFRSAVRKERKYELSGEGLRLFDIRRWEIAHQVMAGPLLGRIKDDWLATAPKIDPNGTPDYSGVANSNQMRVIENRIFNPDRDYLWPIPRIETEVNSRLIQNKNY